MNNVEMRIVDSNKTNMTKASLRYLADATTDRIQKGDCIPVIDDILYSRQTIGKVTKAEYKRGHIFATIQTKEGILKIINTEICEKGIMGIAVKSEPKRKEQQK